MKKKKAFYSAEQIYIQLYHVLKYEQAKYKLAVSYYCTCICRAPRHWVCVCVFTVGGDEVSAAYPAAAVESDADSKQSGAGGADTKRAVPGQRPSRSDHFILYTHTSARTGCHLFLPSSRLSASMSLIDLVESIKPDQNKRF